MIVFAVVPMMSLVGDQTMLSLATKPVRLSVAEAPEQIAVLPEPVTVGSGSTKRYTVSKAVNPQQSVNNPKVTGKKPAVVN